MRACAEGSQHSCAYISPLLYSMLLQRAEPSPVPPYAAKSETQLIVIVTFAIKPLSVIYQQTLSSTMARFYTLFGVSSPLLDSLEF